MEAFKDVGVAQPLLFLKICLVLHHLRPLQQLLDQPSTQHNLAGVTDQVDVYLNIAVILPFP